MTKTNETFAIKNQQLRFQKNIVIYFFCDLYHSQLSKIQLVLFLKKINCTYE